MDEQNQATETTETTEAQAAPAETTTEVGASVAEVATTETETEQAPFDVLQEFITEAQGHPHVPTAVGEALALLQALAVDTELRLQALEKPCEGCAGQSVNVVG